MVNGKKEKLDFDMQVELLFVPFILRNWVLPEGVSATLVTLKLRSP